MSSGAVFYEGPSMLTGAPVVGILTGLGGKSSNAKTGGMAQVFVIRSDKPPIDAVRDGSDVAICGSCSLRGTDGWTERKCYVNVPWAVTGVYKAFVRGVYPRIDHVSVSAGESLRFCAYGDPAALPFDVCEEMIHSAKGWTCYTHAWENCDPRFRSFTMASVDSEREFFRAGLKGWRTFRVRTPRDQLVVGAEFVCPASDESDKTTCEKCQLCRGTASPARSVTILAHGPPRVMSLYRRTK